MTWPDLIKIMIIVNLSNALEKKWVWLITAGKVIEAKYWTSTLKSAWQKYISLYRAEAEESVKMETESKLPFVEFRVVYASRLVQDV